MSSRIEQWKIKLECFVLCVRLFDIIILILLRTGTYLQTI
jgi:hypothetical protein